MPTTTLTAGQRLTAALADQGVTVHTDEDAGNSWLVIALDQTTPDFPGVGTPHLVAYVYEEHEDTVCVDLPLEQQAGPWHVRFNNGRAEIPVFIGTKKGNVAAETAECAASITAYLTRFQEGAEVPDDRA